MANGWCSYRKKKIFAVARKSAASAGAHWTNDVVKIFAKVCQRSRTGCAMTGVPVPLPGRGATRAGVMTFRVMGV